MSLAHEPAIQVCAIGKDTEAEQPPVLPVCIALAGHGVSPYTRLERRGRYLATRVAFSIRSFAGLSEFRCIYPLKPDSFRTEYEGVCIEDTWGAS